MRSHFRNLNKEFYATGVLPLREAIWGESNLAVAYGTVTGDAYHFVPSNWSHKRLRDATRPRLVLVSKVANEDLRSLF